VVWTSALIKKVKRFYNVVSRALDHWFDSTIGGYITEFVVDRVESYSQAERYFFKGLRGKFLHFLKLRINMLLHENNILKIQQLVGFEKANFQEFRQRQRHRGWTYA
jgi:hypothetical protein